MADWWGITIGCEVAFSTDPLGTPSWTDVTDYVREVPRIFRGKTSEESDVSPGYATVILSNRDRRFDPDYASSPYSPDVLPMKRIRITVALGAFSATIFTGFVTSWRNDWRISDGVSVVTAVDSTWWANAEPLPGSAYAAEVLADSPIHYWPLQDVNGGAIAGTQNLHGGAITSDGEPLIELRAAPIGEEQTLSGVRFRTNTGATLRPQALDFWVNISDPAGETNWSIWSGFSDGSWINVQTQGGDGIEARYAHAVDDVRRTTSASNRLILHPGLHHIAAWADATDVYMMVDGVVAWTDTLTAGFSAGGTDSFLSITAGDPVRDDGISHFAVYSTPPSEDRFRAHWYAGIAAHGTPGERSGARIGRVLDDIGWPAGLRAIDTGATTQGTYLPDSQLAVDYIRFVEASERGLFFVDIAGNVTFYDRVTMTDGSLDTGTVLSDDGAAGTIRYERLDMDGATVDTIRNIVTVSYSTVGAITRRDSTSVTAYGAQRLFIDGPTIPKASTASNLAAFELEQRKDPRTRVTSVVCGIRQATSALTTTQVEKLLALEIGDIVDVEVTPLGVTPQVVKTVQVLGIEHELGLEQWYVTLYLSPAYVQTGWFTLGTSALDGADVLLA